MAAACPLSFHDFLAEAELLNYYIALKNDLKIASIHQLKYVEEEDLSQIGMSRPEQRRLKKFYQKYYPQSYLGKFVKKIQTKTSASTSSLYNGSSRRNSGMDQWEGADVPAAAAAAVMHRDGSLVSVTTAASSLPQQPATKTAKYIIPFQSVTLGQILASGNSATTYQGLWTVDQSLTVPCCIKCLNKDYTYSEFLKDAATLHGLEHERIVKFYGLVDTPDSTIMLATELAPNRSLWDCLTDPLLKSTISVMALCDIAQQMCDGMKYLETKGVVHGDLRSRNVLVFPKMKVKIGEIGLNNLSNLNGGSFENGSLLTTNAAWKSPGYLSSGTVSRSADTWAFGVTLWEMFSMGQQPWSGYTSQEILAAISAPSNRRLDQPELCSRDYYSVMLQCWSENESSRPTFSQLSEILPESKPEQLQAIRDNMLISQPTRSRLQYTVGDVIVVLDNNPENAEGMWKGVVKNRRPGLFDPSDTVAYLGTDALPTAINTEDRPKERKTMPAKNKIRRDMISRPQADFRHTGHVGMDGAYFGDVSFLGNGFGNLSALARSYDRTDDDRSMGYGGSRDTTPLISSRLSLPRTIGSESRMSSDSWQNTSSGSPQSISSRSSGNAKENKESPPLSPKKVISTSPPSSSGVLRGTRQGLGICNTQFEREYHDIPDGSLAGGRSVLGGAERRLPMALRPMDDNSFDLDFGPSLMDEIFQLIDGSTATKPSIPALAPTAKANTSLAPVSQPALVPVQPVPVIAGSKTTPVLPDVPVVTIQSQKPVGAASPVALKQYQKPALPETAVPKPAIKPKPQVAARKKLDPLTICKEDITPASAIKSVSPKEEKSLENFITISHEMAAKTLETGQRKSSLDSTKTLEKVTTSSPKLSSLKSRFSFRLKGASKAVDLPPSLPASPRSFSDRQGTEKDLVEQVSAEGKEAYRVLVEEPGKVEIYSPPPVPMEVCEEEDEDASPLKLLRNGVGVNPKMRGNRNGFNRSFSHDGPSKIPLPRIPGEAVTVGGSQSFRLPSKPTATVAPAPARQALPPPPPPPETAAIIKKPERPHIPPPLPPRDRSKPIGGPPAKSRDRKYPLVNDQADSEEESLPAIPDAVSNPQYENPHSPGLLREKSPVGKRFSGGKLVKSPVANDSSFADAVKQRGVRTSQHEKEQSF